MPNSRPARTLQAAGAIKSKPHMALKPKNPDTAPASAAPSPEIDSKPSAAGQTADAHRHNPRIEKNIADFKAAHPSQVEYFTGLVKNDPARAVNYYFYRQWQKHESDTRVAERQLPQAKATFDRMTSESQERVNERMKSVNDYNHTKEFVASVRSEMNRDALASNRRALWMRPAAGTGAPKAAPAMSAG